MGKSFYIRVLKPVPGRFQKDRVFDSQEFMDAGLEPVYGIERADRYHVKVRERSVYASMDDVRAYVREHCPNADFQSFGMSYGLGSLVECRGDGWSCSIPAQAMEEIKKAHVDEKVVTRPVMSWSVDDYEGEWISSRCPGYVTERDLKGVFSSYMAYLKGKHMNEIQEIVERPDACYGSIFPALCKAVAYAHRVGGVVFLEWD